ncbi:hypothetical protein CHS0354_022621 [Potamilus streckersoni]|uniref:Uncharacterized protein n=1 Tax=Potamilus streckersoni TaxID=2493646 RepID=A0AAE0TG55_9BIVA|nr:hypothetical protein CHS0354_022621 [Potamilus streckersoni]
MGCGMSTPTARSSGRRIQINVIEPTSIGVESANLSPRPIGQDGQGNQLTTSMPRTVRKATQRFSRTYTGDFTLPHLPE